MNEIIKTEVLKIETSPLHIDTGRVMSNFFQAKKLTRDQIIDITYKFMPYCDLVYITYISTVEP